jgi:hypothetical protein
MTVITRSQSRRITEQSLTVATQPVEPPVAITRVLDLVYITDVILPLATDPSQEMTAYHIATASNFKVQVKFYLLLLDGKGPDYFENVDIAVSLFSFINQHIKQLYCSNPSEWYKFIITVYNKAKELLTELREKERPVITDKERQIVINLVYELVEAIDKTEVILRRNNYFSSV